MFKYSKNSGDGSGAETLDSAIRAMRSESSTERFSDPSRAAIFEAARRPVGNLAPLASLFIPTHKFALAGSVPLVLMAASLLLMPDPGIPGRRGTRLLASKEGDTVVFTIANGDSPHRVFKTTDPERFGAKEIPVAAGQFSDRADSGIELVFYRVD